MDRIVQNIRKRIGETVIYGESGYMKGLDCPKYKEKDWRKSDLRGVGIYEEEWVSGYMKRNGLEGLDVRGVQIYEEEWTGLSKI